MTEAGARPGRAIAAALGCALLLACGSNGGGADGPGTVDAGDAAAGDGAGGSSAGGNTGGGGNAGNGGNAGGGGNGGNGGLGPVQCRTTADCPSQEQPPTAGGCFATRPGGVCTRCDVRNACPAGTQCLPDLVDVMVCARPCASDAACNAGMFCNLQGFCAQRTCVNDPCPAPYVCDAARLCVRPRCDGDGGVAGACPPPLVCNTTGLCVEP